MIPEIIMLLPHLLIIRGEIIPLPFGPSWMNSLQGLTVPFMGNIFVIFLLRQYFKKIPKEFIVVTESGIKSRTDIDKYNDVGVFNFLIGPISLLSGTFFSVDVIHESWKNIFLLNPFYHLISNSRKSFENEQIY